MFWSCLLLAILLPSALAKGGSCEEKLRECESRAPSRLVCGSDNKTYPTRCHLLKARCAGNPTLTVVQTGPCSDEQPCWADQGGKGGTEGGLEFVPKCLPNGQYAPVQCHEGTGYCWCVTPQGKPLSNTSVRHATPVCVTHKHRRDPTRRDQKHRKACRKIDRTKLINNLVRIFKVEFTRADKILASGNETELEKMGVEWKFGILDINSNKNLTINEYQDLKKLVRKAVKPKKCSRNFINICDKDKDTIITYEEWTSCLVKKPIAKKFNKKKKSSSKVGSPHLSPGLPGLLSDHTPQIEELPPEKKDEPEVSDCLTDRKNVLGELTEIHIELFIPECTPDGRYQKIQCYRSTGYCWCVNEDSGKPIPGTSLKDLNPKCDALQLPMRPMKGCPEHKKKLFLGELREFFIKKYPSSSDPTGEEFAIWTFQIIDTNKNKILEKKEMGPLRTLVLSFSQNVKRCGKKFSRYCDVNHDKKISLTEWVNCLDFERSAVGMTVTTSPVRRGPNPLETILKPDDYD